MTHRIFLVTILLAFLLITPVCSYANSVSLAKIQTTEMRRVVLGTDSISGVNYLTQDLMPITTGKNTIYVISSKFVIKNDIIIPENSVLCFQGGAIDGKHNLIGRGAYISGDLINVFGPDVFLLGEWNLQNISPDWFVGTDIEKLQKAFEVSISLRSSQITIDRTYDLTGGTIYLDRGFHSTDEISKWSRRNLIVSGSGEGRLIKEDPGFMFSAKSGSIDFDFNQIHFRGYLSNPSDLNTVVEMYVFDCRYLGNVRVSNSTFCHCGCVYYQTGGVSTPMQGVLSIGNQYLKNKCVMYANECWHSQFIGDTVEDGLTFIKGEKIGSSIRDLKITNCCVEGFYHENKPAIDLNCNASGLSIIDTYFEANYCSIKIPRYVSGIISGNTFHSRGSYIKKGVELHCIELADLEDIEITANNVVIDDDNMYMFYFDTTSPYYGQSQVLYGKNNAAGKTKLSNIPNKVKDLREVLSVLEKEYIRDITNNMKRAYPQIRSGKIIVSSCRGITTISISNLVISSPISSGTYSGNINQVKPFNSYLPIDGAIIDKDKNLMGTLFITSSGGIGLRMNQSGTYNGIITYPCARDI